MGIKFYDSNRKYWGEYDETRSLFIPSEETTTQTETQNSNLTFEKDECAKEYEELGLKELKELIEADRKTENSFHENKFKDDLKRGICWNCKHLKKHTGELAEFVCDIKGSVVTDTRIRECDEMGEKR